MPSFAKLSSPFANQMINHARNPMERHMRTLHASLAQLATLMSLSLAPALAGAQETKAVAQCRSITVEAERLSCYDKVVDGEGRTPPVKGQRSYGIIRLTDLKLYQADMSGSLVQASGLLKLAGRYGLLGSDYEDPHPLAVDLETVPREQRRKVLERCTDNGCIVTVRGTVGQILSMPGIAADTIDVRWPVVSPMDERKEVR